MKKYNQADAYILGIIIKDLCKATTDAQKEIIENYVNSQLNQEYISVYGRLRFQTKANTGKTVAEKIEANNKQIAKYIAENEKLAKLPQNEILTEKEMTLYTDKYPEGLDEGKRIVQDILLDELTSKRMSNKLDKIVASKAKRQ